MLDGYWTSKAGLRHQQRWRERRRVLAWVAQEPERKGPRGARSADAFRSQFEAGSVGSDRGYWPRARLALELDFTTARRQPPNIVNLAKHYLDLLGRRDDGGGRPLLYHDDSQVKMLYVSCRHSWDPDAQGDRGQIRLACAPRVDAIAEMEAAHVLAMAGDPEPGVDGPDHGDLHVGSRLKEALEFEASGDPRLLQVAAHIRFDVLRDHQESFLRASDRWLSHLFQRRARELITGTPATWRARAARAAASLPAGQQKDPFRPDTLSDELQGFFLVPLPPLPTQSGEGEPFKKALDGACRRYVEAHPALSPLVVPLRITVLVVPPHQKDLDNLALEVVPSINRRFRPPQDPWLVDGTHLDQPEGLQTCDDQRRRRDLARLRSIGPHSVWAYQVIQLHRQPQHPREGWMAVVLGHGENHRSLWSEAETYVNTALETT